MGEYLIPANSKSGQLIFNLFRPIDLIILGIGVGISFVMLLLVPVDTLKGIILVLLPGGISCFLVIPVPNYHNVLNVIVNGYKFFTTNRKYIWRGWSVLDEFKK